MSIGDKSDVFSITCLHVLTWYFSQLLYVAIIRTWTEKAMAGIPNVSDVAFRMEHTMVTVRERARKLYGWSFGGRTPTGCTAGGTYKTLDCDVDWIHLTIPQDAVLTAELVSVYNILLWCSCVAVGLKLSCSSWSERLFWIWLLPYSYIPV